MVQVTFVVPWLARCDQDTVFPNNLSFEAPHQQEVCMREWVKQRTGLSPEFDIVWYPGTHSISETLLWSMARAVLGASWSSCPRLLLLWF